MTWQPIKTAKPWDRIIVAGWKPRNGTIPGYWWHEEAHTDSEGAIVEDDLDGATKWHPFPELPEAPE